jgi:hypothetical protein
VSAVDVILGNGLEQELKKLANGTDVADAARLAAAIFFINSRRVFWLSIIFYFFKTSISRIGIN